VIGGGLLIDSRLSSDAVNEDCTYNSTPGISGLNKNDNKIMIEEEAENAFGGSPRENERIEHQHRQQRGQQRGWHQDDTFEDPRSYSEEVWQ
jgi:hypothetical protein